MLYVAVEKCADTREEMHKAALSLCNRVLSCFGIREDIIYNEKGKPYLKSGDAHISLSHSHGAVCCAVNTLLPQKTADKNIVFELSAPCSLSGIDIEYLCDKDNLIMITRRFFSSLEQEAFLKNPTVVNFFEIYTRKEAIVKKSGVGLSGLCKADSEKYDGFIRTEKININEKTYILSVCS